MMSAIIIPSIWNVKRKIDLFEDFSLAFWLSIYLAIYLYFYLTRLPGCLSAYLAALSLSPPVPLSASAISLPSLYWGLYRGILYIHL